MRHEALPLEEEDAEEDHHDPAPLLPVSSSTSDLPWSFVGLLFSIFAVFLFAKLRSSSSARPWPASNSSLYLLPRTWPRPSRVIRSVRSPELGGFFRLSPYYSTATLMPANITHLGIDPKCQSWFTGSPSPSTGRLELNSIRNAIVVPSSYIFTPRFVYTPGCPGHPRSEGGAGPGVVDMTKVQIVDEGIYFFHIFHGCYFHLMAESLPHLLGLETTVLANSLILVITNPIKSVFRDMLDIYGVTAYRLYLVQSYVFVRNLHVTTPWIAGRAYFNPTRGMVEFVTQKLKLTRVKPSRKVAIQRKEKGRRIINWVQMCAALDKEFGEFDQFHTASIRDQVRLFRNSILMLAARGSGIVNTIWMLPKTVLVEIQTRHCNPNFAYIALQSGMLVVETTRGYIFSNSPILVELSMVLNAVRVGLQLYQGAKKPWA
jgi:hypothetical protein